MNSFSTIGDPVSVFYYKGKYYCNRTKIALTDDYIKYNKFNGQKIWKYAMYSHKIVGNGTTKYFFNRCKNYIYDLDRDRAEMEEYDSCTPYFTIEAFGLEDAIEKIIKPIEFTNTEMLDFHLPKKDSEVDGMMTGWVIYIAAMIGSLIFSEFYILWAFITIVFFKWREGKINP